MNKRTISYAYDNTQSKTVNICDSIKSNKDGFALRNDYNLNTQRFSCIECEQKLVISHSIKDNVYFRHFPNSDYCLLKDSKLHENVLVGYRDNAFARESPRHKELKNKIGRLLHHQEGVDIASIDIDSKFLIRGDQKRRPDVFCHFEGKPIVFEIQLSPLPQHYIKHRYDFYRNNGIYLIWILDISGPVELKAFERDLKYIWSHQNLFQLDESNHSTLKMICHYKQPFIFNNTEIHQKWLECSIGLPDLTFEESNFSCYYFDYIEANRKTGEMLLNIEEQQEKKAAEEIIRIKEEKNKRIISGLISDIKKFLVLDYNFYRPIKQVNNLNSLETEQLNHAVNLQNRKNGVPLFLHYIKDYKPRNDEFKHTIADLLLGCVNFKFNINLRDENGNGIIQYLYLNHHLQDYRYRLIPFIFNRGYILEQVDRIFLTTTVEKGEIEHFKLRCLSYCDNAIEIAAVSKNINYFIFIESAKQGKIINSNLKYWVQYLVPIIVKYTTYWTYTKIVLAKTDLGELLQLIDKKQTIKKKIVEFHMEQAPQSEDIIGPLMKLYPEIFAN